MKALITLKCFFFVLLLGVQAYAQDFSNRMPLPLVRSLTEQGLWLKEFENFQDPKTQEAWSFWNVLQNGTSEQIIGNLFSSENQNGFMALPELYKFKVACFRYLRGQNSNERLAAIEKSILNKYIEVTISLIRLSGVAQYNATLETLKADIRAGRVQLKDLSPSLRNNLSQPSKFKTSQHSLKLNTQQNGVYLVNGAFIESSKTLAVDISRSINETVVSLSHEIIHAADPEIRAKKQAVTGNFSKVISELKAKSLAPEMVSALIRDIFFEMGRPDMADLIDKAREARLENINQALANTAYADLTKNAVIAQWTKDLIASTIENEFKAYVLSLAVYLKLNDRFEILPPSLERNGFINKLLDHNSDFARTLSVAMNPFTKGFALSTLTKNKTVTMEMAEEAQKIQTVLEHHYLTQSKTFLVEMQQRYAALLQEMKQISAANRVDWNAQQDLSPSWTRPGNFESPTNPYVILTAKLSTLWAIRFKQAMQQMLNDLRATHSSLLAMKAGILDLHSVSLGELKLLGLQPANSTGTHLPREVTGNLRTDLADQPAIMKKLFADTQWQPTSFADRTYVSQSELMSNLSRLYLVKALHWLRESFPPAKENIVSIKTLQLKIHEGFYDRNEITDERAREISEELTQSLEQARLSSNELASIHYLMDAVGALYYVAAQEQWNVVAQEFDQKMRSGLALLQNMGLEGTLTVQQIQANTAAAISGVTSQISKNYRQCAKAKDLQFISNGPALTLGSVSFVPTVLCYNGQIYILRQPGDYTRSATTLIKEGSPETRIFIGGRPIRLTPFAPASGGGSRWRR